MDIVGNKLTPGPVHVLGGSWGSTLAMEWLVTKRPTMSPASSSCVPPSTPRAPRRRGAPPR
jgi:hypothetical protein